MSFSHQCQLVMFHRNLSDSKSHQVSGTLVSILADLNNTVVLIRFPISNSFCPFTKPLGTVPSAPITIGITVNLMIRSFFSSPTRSKYSSLFLLSSIFILWSARTAKSTIRQVLFFLLFSFFYHFV